MPFSKQDGSGFENKIAAILADELSAQLSYIWFAQRRGFLRNTLNSGSCDVVMGYPPNYQMLRSTRRYYRSSYVFVRRTGEHVISSYDDPVRAQRGAADVDACSVQSLAAHAAQLPFDIAVAVGKEDVELANELDVALRIWRQDIDAILKDYGVPRTDAAGPADTAAAAGQEP